MIKTSKHFLLLGLVFPLFTGASIRDQGPGLNYTVTGTITGSIGNILTSGTSTSFNLDKESRVFFWNYAISYHFPKAGIEVIFGSLPNTGNCHFTAETKLKHDPIVPKYSYSTTISGEETTTTRCLVDGQLQKTSSAPDFSPNLTVEKIAVE